MDGFGLRAFRARLRRELPEWERDGLVTSDAAKELLRRYGAEEPGADAATLAIYVLGTLLIGGGVLSFVAWNWEALSDGMKLALGATAMLTCHALGFWWWRIDGGRAKLGHAITFLGTLVFAANVGLVAQVFHISEHWYNGALAIGAGALAGTIAYRSTPQALLSLLTLATYAVSREESGPPIAAFLLFGAFLVMAVRLSSVAVFSLLVPVATTVLTVDIARRTGTEGVVSAIVVLVCTFVAFAHAGSGLLPRFGGVSERWATMGLVGLAYMASFQSVAEELSFREIDEAGPLLYVFLLLVGGVALWGHGKSRGTWTDSPLSKWGTWACVLILLAMIPGDSDFWVFAAANLALALISGASIVSSVGSLDRRRFWFGTTLAAFLVGSRFFEFEAGLLVKSIVFTVLGGAVIGLGLVFERKLKRSAS